MAGYRIVAQAFYSLQDTKTPVKIAVVAFVANMLLQQRFHLLWTPLAHGGLALATSLASMLNITLLTYCSGRKIGRIDARRIRSVPAQDHSRVGCDGRDRLVGQQEYALGRAGPFPGQGRTADRDDRSAAFVFYLVLMWIMRSEELGFLWGMVKRKAKRQG